MVNSLLNHLNRLSVQMNIKYLVFALVSTEHRLKRICKSFMSVCILDTQRPNFLGSEVVHLLWYTCSAHQSTLQCLLRVQEGGKVSKEVRPVSKDAAQFPEQQDHFLSFSRLLELIQQRHEGLHLPRYVLQRLTHLQTHSNSQVQISASSLPHLVLF